MISARYVSLLGLLALLLSGHSLASKIAPSTSWRETGRQEHENRASDSACSSAGVQLNAPTPPSAGMDE
jgi:hypothetical protein